MGTNSRQASDGGLEFVDDSTASVIGKVGGVNNRNVKIAKVTMSGVAATTGGALLSWINPENVPIIIDRFQVDVTTKSTGAAAFSAGVGASATTSYANLIDSYAIGGTEKVVDNHVDGSTNGKFVQKLLVGQFVTGSATATTVGLVSTVYIHYHLA